MWRFPAAAAAACVVIGGLYVTNLPPDIAPIEALQCADHIADTVTDLDAQNLTDGAYVYASWDVLVDDCEAMGMDPAFVKHVGPAYPPCPNDEWGEWDYVCHWNARTQGNGKGASFISYPQR
jgi:hypothetical protein